MAAVAWVLNHEWAPSHLIASPMLVTKQLGALITRHLIRYVNQINRDAILQDFSKNWRILQVNTKYKKPKT